MSIPAPSQTSLPLIWEDSPNVISSPVSPAGPLRSLSLDGLRIALRGLAPAPVSPLVLRGRGKAPPMSGTSGPSLPNSSAAVALPSSSESKSPVLTLSGKLGLALTERLQRFGSMEYLLTWKQHTTPAGRLIFRLRASARPISASASIGWPTPCTQDGPNGGPSQGVDRLPGAASMAGWPTPDAYPRGGPQDPAKRKAGGHSVTLQDAATLAGWCSPSARDWKDTPGMATTGTNPDGSERARLDQLPRQVTLAGWATPCVPNGGRRPKGGAMSSTGMTPDGKKRQVDLDWLARGVPHEGSSAETGKPAAFRLNPWFSGWLMGFPPQWGLAALKAYLLLSKGFRSRKPKSQAASSCSVDTGTPSCPKSPPSSSAPTSKPHDT